MEELRYSIIIDGRDAIGCADLETARFHAQTATLNAVDQVEIYDGKAGEVAETFYPEEPEEEGEEWKNLKLENITILKSSIL